MPTRTRSDAATRRRGARRQQERRAETRTKLLEATLDSLAEVGYAATTSRRVAEAAGVSQGAQTYHFPYRVDLVGAAVEHLAERRIAALRQKAAGLPAAPHERVSALLDLIWADFSSPLFTALVKVWVVAADDPELHERLVPVERRLTQVIGELSREFFGELASRPNARRLQLTVLSSMRGLALTQRFEPRRRRGPDRWPELRASLLDLLMPEIEAGSG
jgi:AcrR family transcriptional regulator